MGGACGSQTGICTRMSAHEELIPLPDASLEAVKVLMKTLQLGKTTSSKYLQTSSFGKFSNSRYDVLMYISTDLYNLSYIGLWYN